MFGGIISGVGNVVTGTVNAATVVAGTVVNGAGQIISGAVNGVENLFATAGNVFKPIANNGNDIIGQLTEVGGTVLKVPFNIIEQLGTVLNVIVGNLGNLSTELFTSFGATLKFIASTGKAVAVKLDDTLNLLITSFDDHLIKPALVDVHTAFSIVTDALNKAIAAATTNILGLVTDFDAEIKDATAIAANTVTNLAAGLIKQINSSVASAVTIAKCDVNLKVSLAKLAANTLPNIALCVVPSASFNVSKIASKAIATIGLTVEGAKNIVDAIETCVSPVLASPKDSQIKDTAIDCLWSVSYT